MKKNFLLLIFLLIDLIACQDKPGTTKIPESFEGVWKVTGPQGQVYYMTLKKDGSGSTTREGGEFGTWKSNGDEIEAKWISKNLKINFSSGSVKVPGLSTNKAASSQSSLAEKVEKIPD